jgi:hypothetical protein
MVKAKMEFNKLELTQALIIKSRMEGALRKEGLNN